MRASTSRNGSTRRLYILAAILVFWCCAICVRLIYLQIFRYGDFQQRAAHQQQRTVEVAAKRGIIYDRAGRELAMTINVDSVFAVPQDNKDLANAISLITRITHDDPREILARCMRNLSTLQKKPENGWRREPRPETLSCSKRLAV